MIEEVAGWLAGHSFILGCDGAYSSLAGRDLPRTHVVSRIQRNAALYDLAPPSRPGQRGRPRKKGARLGTPVELAAQAVDGWTIADIDVRGEQVERALWARPLLWYAVRPLQQIIMLVVVADPAQREHDDLQFSTDLTFQPELLASLYYERWSIEDTFRNNSSCWAARSLSAGRRRVQSGRLRSPSGPTRRCRSGTWPAPAPDRPGERGPGIPPSELPRSPMRWPRCDVRSGRSGFSKPPNRARCWRKSHRRSSTPSLRPHSTMAQRPYAALRRAPRVRKSTLGGDGRYPCALEGSEPRSSE